MSQLKTTSSARPSGMSLPYLAIWALLAAIAVGYLSLLAIRPDLASGLIVGPATSSPESNRGQRAMTRALAELDTVKKQLGKVEADLGDMRKQAVAESQRNMALETRVATIEAALRGSGTPVAAAVPGLEFPSDGTAPDRATKSARDSRPAPPLPTQKPAIASTTGSIKAPEVKQTDNKTADTKATESKAVETKSPPVGIIVASGPSLDAVRLSWQLLQDGNGRTLKSLEPRYIESGAEPGAYQLLAGPIATREDAIRICDRLKVKQVRCSVTEKFAGQPL